MLQEGLYSLLISTASITDLVGVRGVFSGKMPEAPRYPIIVIEQGAGQGIPIFEGVSALRSATMLFSCYATTKEAAGNLMKAVRDLLDGFKGVLPDETDVHNGKVSHEKGSFEFAPFVYEAPLEIEFLFVEPD